jgi:hypothetical protein
MNECNSSLDFDAFRCWKLDAVLSGVVRRTLGPFTPPILRAVSFVPNLILSGRVVQFGYFIDRFARGDNNRALSRTSREHVPMGYFISGRLCAFCGDVFLEGNSRFIYRRWKKRIKSGRRAAFPLRRRIKSDANAKGSREVTHHRLLP